MSPLSLKVPSVTSAEFVRHFGVWQDRAANEPVTVTHHGRARLVLLAAQRYRELVDAETRGGGVAAELWLAALLDHLDAAFVAFDGQGRVARINLEAAGYFRVLRETVTGREPGEDMPDLLRLLAQRQVQRARASGQSATFDAPAMAYPGEWLRCRVFPFGDDVALIFRTVTVEHMLRRTVAAHAAMERALSAHGGIGIGLLNPRGRFVTADAALAAMAGRDVRHLEHAPLTGLFAEGDEALVADAVEAVLTAGAPQCFRCRPADGEHAVTLALAPVTGDYGIDGATVVMTPSA